MAKPKLIIIMITEQLILQLQVEISAMLPEMMALRHALHRVPEPALQEVQTRAVILAALPSSELQIHVPLLGTDIIADLGVGEGMLALRADIDALPITEETELPYSSNHAGFMHACGHDGHAAMLAGAANVLAKYQEKLTRRVRFIWQPGEEVRAAGRDLVRLGACDGVEEVYAIHAWPGLPAGAICTGTGAILAAASFFTIRVIGVGGHGAYPERGKNPIPIAAQLVSRLTEEHRRLHTREGAVISVCAFSAGTNGNIIPDEAVLQGTTRYLSVEMADEMARMLQSACDDFARENDVAIVLDYRRSYEIPVVNTPAGAAKIRRAAVSAFGEHAFIEMAKPTMGSEDFAYYLPGREGGMLLLGQGEQAHNVHTSTFNFNDDTLAAGILMHCLLALS